MRRRRRKRSRRVIIVVIGMAVAGYLIIWYNTPEKQTAATSPSNGVTLSSVERDEDPGAPEGRKPNVDKGVASHEPVQQAAVAKGLRLFELARQSSGQDDLVAARTQYNEALQLGLPAEQDEQTRKELVRLGQQMIFSGMRYKGDRLVSNHVVQPGDTLQKIAKEFKVTAELLARINELPNANMIRAGQNLKVIHGPFHAEIHKGKHVIRLFLQDIFVTEFPVGLGEEGRTPCGKWVIKNKLTNPTYYPPRGGDIIMADDPENPLGEYWLGLQGISGDALGQERYGIHGTIEPESIGQNASLGCVRLYNADVERLYEMLIVKESEVTIYE